MQRKEFEQENSNTRLSDVARSANVSGQDDTMETNNTNVTRISPDSASAEVEYLDYLPIPEFPAEAFQFCERALIADEKATATPEEFFAEGTLPLKVECLQPRMSEADQQAVVDTITAQPHGYKFQPTKYTVNGIEVPKYLHDMANEHVDLILQLAARVKDLEDFNKKLLVALKHMGYDTNKWFR